MSVSEHHAAARSGEVDFIALLLVAWRYRFFISAIALVCTCIAIGLALSTAPVYKAEVVVTDAGSSEVGGSGLASQLGGLAGIAGINLGKGGANQEAHAVLRSRYLVEQFIGRNQLVSELLTGSSEAATLWHAVKLFRESIVSIQADDDAGTTTVSIEWTDAEEAARWANAFVALANEIVRARALNDSTRNIEYLKEQIAKTDVVELQRVMYRLVEEETKTQMLANARQEYAFTIVDPAVVPEQRIWPRRTLMVLTGGVLGGILGVILALAINFWRRYNSEQRE